MSLVASLSRRVAGNFTSVEQGAERRRTFAHEAASLRFFLNRKLQNSPKPQLSAIARCKIHALQRR
jgi:hypothetical protein